jgi:hypothetical protein
MDVIPPLTADQLAVGAAFTIDPTMLVSSSIAEPSVGEVVWISGATYGEGDQAILGAPSATVTLSIASPGVVTWASHGIPEGTPTILTTTGALPTGLTAGRIYYVVKAQAGSFQLAAERGGRPIVTTGSQSGVHTATAHIHRTFESLLAGNTGHPPAIDDGTNWIDVGPTNRWAMFDVLRNTQSIGPSPVTVVIAPGQRVDAIGLVQLVADGGTIEVIRGGVVRYSYTRRLVTRPTTGWYSYFFGKFRQIGEVGRKDLPPFTDAEIHITLTRAQGDVRCGGVVIGQHVYIGDVGFGAEDDALNFSTIDRKFDGSSELVRRRSVPKTSQTLRAPKKILPAVRRLRNDLNAVPALWMAIDDVDDPYFEAFLILGIYKVWRNTADLDTHFQQQLDLEEV